MNYSAGLSQQQQSGFDVDFSALFSAAQEEQAATLNDVEQTPSGARFTWNVTPEQIAKINAGDKDALAAFFFDEDNNRRIGYCASKFIRRNTFLQSIITAQDLTQQAFCDLLCGLLKFRPWDAAISTAIFHSFRYAAVGGIDEVYIPARKGAKNV